MLTFDEVDIVTEVLLKLVRRQPDARAVLVTRMEDRLADVLNNGPPAVVVAMAIKICSDDGRNSDPPALVRLIGLVRDQDERIPPLIKRLSYPPVEGGPDPADRFMDNLLFTDLPFLERGTTRTALRALLQTTPQQPFVVINGLSKLGKSYTANFIGHVLRGRNDLMACIVPVAPKSGASIGPGELARDLVARMSGDSSTQPKNDTNLDRWCEELVSWITAPGIKEQITWWIIFDGFNGAELRDDTKLLIAKLAARLTNAKPQRFFRLILLDFDHTALPVTPGLIKVDVIQPIPKSSVNTFLTGIFGGASGIDVPTLYNKVTHGLSDPIIELPELGQRLGSLIAEARA